VSVPLPHLISSPPRGKRPFQRLLGISSHVAPIAMGGAVLALALVVLSPAHANAATGHTLRLSGASSKDTYRLGEPVMIHWTLLNAGTIQCQASRVTDGSLTFTLVTRNGSVVHPRLTRIDYDEDLSSFLAQRLTPLAVQSTLATTMVSQRSGLSAESQVLRTVSWSEHQNHIALLWPINAPGEYAIFAVYAVPNIAGSANVCLGASTAAMTKFRISSSGSSRQLVQLIALTSIGLGILIGIIVMRARKNRHARLRRLFSVLTLAVTILLIMSPIEAGGNVIMKPTSRSAPPRHHRIAVIGEKGFVDAANQCLAIFNSPGGDPAHILPDINENKSESTVLIQQNETGDDDGTWKDVPENDVDTKADVTISWTSSWPEGTVDLAPIPEIGIPKDPCAGLYHELYHARDGILNTNGGDSLFCDNTWILSREVRAVFAENAYRLSRRPPLRPKKYYGTLELPKSPGECKAETAFHVNLEPCNHGPCASDNGDPHISTFDGSRYDFQAVGEFIAAKSSTDSLEIQTRQARWFDDTEVSVNSAAAMNVAGDRLGFYVRSTGIIPYLNGSPTVFKDGITRLAQGGTVRRSDTAGYLDGYLVSWPDSSRAWVSPVGSWGIKLDMALAANRRGHVVGLLGNYDTNPSNDLISREGKQLAHSPSFHDLYQVFGNSWRIRQEESLFDYPSGETTATFTDRHLPTQPVTSTDLPNHDAAQAICRDLGITDPTILQECALDVAVTGQAAFSDSAAATQAALTAGSSSGGGSSTRQAGGLVATLTPTARPRVFSVDRAGQTVRASFAGTAGQALDLGFTAVTLGGDNHNYEVTVLAPDGSKLADGSLLSNSDSLHLDPLAATGRYTVIVNPYKASTGTITITLSNALAATLTPTARPRVFSVDRAGQTVRASFAGTAGQALDLGFTGVTLGGDNHYYWVTVLAPDGSKLADGSLLPSDSLHLDPLAATGRYTVIVNPNNASTGTITITITKRRP
jgi:hypothetical protein